MGSFLLIGNPEHQCCAGLSPRARWLALVVGLNRFGPIGAAIRGLVQVSAALSQMCHPYLLFFSPSSPSPFPPPCLSLPTPRLPVSPFLALPRRFSRKTYCKELLNIRVCQAEYHFYINRYIARRRLGLWYQHTLHSGPYRQINGLFVRLLSFPHCMQPWKGA